MARGKLYKLTDGDRRIFERARKENDPNWITDYYLRSENSGTWWRPVYQEQMDELEMPESKAAAQRLYNGYSALFDIWDKLKRPDFFGPADNSDRWTTYTQAGYDKRASQLQRVYRTQWEMELSDPIFHHPHGVRFLPWQLDMHRSQHPIQVVIGGMGSSKTYGKALSMIVRAITLTGYRAFSLAPVSYQAEEVFKIIMQMIEGTPFERFLITANVKPALLVFGNDMVGETRIEFFPIKDNSQKLLTLSGDEALIDQAEQVDDLVNTLANVGTRMRAQVRGRPRRGQVTLVANSEDNPELWDLYDEAALSPKKIWACAPTSFDNPYLVVKDYISFEAQVGKDPVRRAMKLKGERPIGSGEHFSFESIMKCRSAAMDDEMNRQIEQETPGWRRVEAPHIGTVLWESPPKPDRRYLVAADPGWGNPPNRNSPVIGVWDYTDYPRVPLFLTAFAWVYGHNNPNPWLQKYNEYVIKYQAIGLNGYDGTGTGAGYNRMTDIGKLGAIPVIMGDANKYVYLNLTKRMVANGLFQAPASIQRMWSQMSKYELNNDKLPQDIVSMLLVVAALVEPLEYMDLGEDQDDGRYENATVDRYYRHSDMGDPVRTPR